MGAFVKERRRLPKGWEMRTIGDVCESGSSNVSQNQLDDEVGDYPIFGASGLIKNVSFYHQEKPYLSIVKDGSGVGRVTRMDGYTSVIGTLQYILPKENVDLNYLYYNLISIDFKKYLAGTAIPHIYFKDYKNEPFLWMPLHEQQRIVVILDKVFAAIAKARSNIEKNLHNAKEFLESYLQSVFEKKGRDWENKTLKEVCAKITDGTHQTPKYYDHGIIFLSSKNVKSRKIDWNNIKYIDEKQHLEMHKRVAPRMGDILLAKNGTTGVAAMVDRDVIFDIYVSLAHIRVLEEVTPEFMLYFINSPVAKKQFNRRLKGSGVPNLHLEEIREVVISFPKSKIDQRSIVRKLSKISAEINKLEAIYKCKLENLEEIKKSILQKAFNGELVEARV
ncbi:MAG: restriction modification system specificity domain protein [Gammaproteobacteria bacterium]|jgi:type I restriction enzyme S subunit|nr:restriction modification system specificity domain protein [Gammaproteobacteria bacterium]